MPTDLTLKETTLRPEIQVLVDQGQEIGAQQQPTDKASLLNRLFVNSLSQAQSLEEEQDVLKGAIISPATAGPDILGTPIDPLSYLGPAAGDVRRQLEGQGVEVAETQALLNPITGEPFSGDYLREIVDLDKNSGYGMLGEMLGGWDSLIAKAPMVAAKVVSATKAAAPAAFAAWLASKKAVPGEVNTFYGGRAAANYHPRAIEKMETAIARLDAGDDPAEVLLQTGWARDGGGNMNFFASDKNMRINEEVIKNRFLTRANLPGIEVGDQVQLKFDLDELLLDTHLFDMIPEAKGMPIFLTVKKLDNDQWGYIPGVGAAYTPPQESGLLNRMYSVGRAGKIEVFNANNVDELKGTILHEIQHMVQAYEGWTGGANTRMFQIPADQYIEARKFRKVFNDFEEQFSDIDWIGEDDINDFLIDWVIRNVDTVDGWNIQEVAREAGYIRQSILHEIAVAMNGKDAQTLDSMRLLLAQDVERSVANAAIALKLGGETAADKARMLGEVSDLGVYDQVMRRYFAQPGEVQARINDYNRNQDLQTVQRKLVEANGDWLELMRQADFRWNASQPSRIVTPENARGLFDSGVDPSMIRKTDDVIAPDRARTQSQRGDKPVFDTGQTVERMANRNRGGTDGGLLDAGRDDSLYRDPSTQRTGTLEELFPSLDEVPDEGLEGIAENVGRDIPRHLDMEKGHNIVKVPVSGGRLGAVKLDLLKNPTEREFNKWQKQADVWSLRSFRTEDGDLFVWNAYSEALHDDVAKYLGNPKMKGGGIDYADNASTEDIREMIAGTWYGNDL